MQCLVDGKILLQKGCQRQIIIVGDCGGRAALGLDRIPGKVDRRGADLVAPTKGSAIKRRRQTAIHGRRKDLLLKLGERHVDVGRRNAASCEYCKLVHIFRDICPRQRRLSYLSRSVCGAGRRPTADRSRDAVTAGAQRGLVKSFG
jgi:hypothetical protein